MAKKKVSNKQAEILSVINRTADMEEFAALLHPFAQTLDNIYEMNGIGNAATAASNIRALIKYIGRI